MTDAMTTWTPEEATQHILNKYRSIPALHAIRETITEVIRAQRAAEVKEARLFCGCGDAFGADSECVNCVYRQIARLTKALKESEELADCLKHEDAIQALKITRLTTELKESEEQADYWENECAKQAFEIARLREVLEECEIGFDTCDPGKCSIDSYGGHPDYDCDHCYFGSYKKAIKKALTPSPLVEVQVKMWDAAVKLANKAIEKRLSTSPLSPEFLDSAIEHYEYALKALDKAKEGSA